MSSTTWQHYFETQVPLADEPLVGSLPDSLVPVSMHRTSCTRRSEGGPTRVGRGPRLRWIAPAPSCVRTTSRRSCQRHPNFGSGALSVIWS
jgi:hypothetical protein